MRRDTCDLRPSATSNCCEAHHHQDDVEIEDSTTKSSVEKSVARLSQTSTVNVPTIDQQGDSTTSQLVLKSTAVDQIKIDNNPYINTSTQAGVEKQRGQ